MTDDGTGTGLTPATVQDITHQVDSLRDELVELVQALVRVPSVTGSEGAVQEVVAARMRGLGLETEVWEPRTADLLPYQDEVGAIESLDGRPNVVGTWRGLGGQGRSLILNAHIDTVETGDPARWHHPPFAAEVAGGKIWGRGSCDMKGGLATHLIALRAIRSLGLVPAADVTVQSVVSEEDGGAGAAAAVLRGPRADAAIITEPTRLAMIPAQGGSIVFRLHVEGKSAHACVRDEGVSAIEAFQTIHRGLIAFEAHRNATLDHPLYQSIANKIPISIGTVRAGAWPSSVPEWLEAEGRAGMVPGESMGTFREQFVAEVARIAAGDPWLRHHPPRVEWFGGQFAPAEVAPDSDIARAVIDAHAAVTGAKPPVEAATYGADMRHFLHLAGIPCVMYGAGDVRVAHFTDEHVSIDDLVTATKTIAVTVASWCGVAPAN
ncbi:MAG: ArgE/DapE family deacylase [Chloroflexia bacterium]|nr:ArgE/DapE family deacylase [Chloroflexia bacterium]